MALFITHTQERRCISKDVLGFKTLHAAIYNKNIWIQPSKKIHNAVFEWTKIVNGSVNWHMPSKGLGDMFEG